MKFSDSRQLPLQVYSPEQVRQNEAKAAATCGLSLFELMQKAGNAVFELIQLCYFKPENLCIVVGKGNNAGDGFIVAQLAAEAGWQVTIATMPECAHWQGDAEKARQLAKHHKISFSPVEQINFADYAITLDAILGTGLKKVLTSSWQQVIETINQQAKLIISVDVPTGLNAKSGCVMGSAIKATHTVTFVGLKTGLLTAEAADYIGQLHFAGLSVDQSFNQQNQVYYRLTHLNLLKAHLAPRKRNSHKGDFGHLLCIGGDKGMAGAIRMTAEAALRAGAGLVSVITHPENVTAVGIGRPELMVSGINGITQELKEKVAAADAVVIGPGLGKSGWANGLMQYIIEQDCIKVVDADGLNWLAANPSKQKKWILTPHPGEAGRLLQQSNYHVQYDRYAAATELQAVYGGVVVLKGCGTLIANSDNIAICRQGNPGMASGGMGDVLAGIIGALLAQKFELNLAAELAVCLHAQAGDLAAKEGERGLLATDLFTHIRTLANQAL